jgi:formyltetrahydrofolate-dependent phosphoribosylglycinamide formyltransferase
MRLVLMVSGSGSNLQAIIDAIQAGDLAAEIALVVSNRSTAYALERAQNAGIPTLYFPLKPYRERGLDRAHYDADLATWLSAYQPDLIVLAGWMHILSPVFLNQFDHRVINLHPALPGTFPGIDAIDRAYEAYQRGEIPHGGCMIHFVIPEVDAGDVIAQSIVPIHPGDTLDDYETRMHEAEHRLIVDAIRRVMAMAEPV